jgi:hypothetical protein
MTMQNLRQRLGLNKPKATVPAGGSTASLPQDDKTPPPPKNPEKRGNHYLKGRLPDGASFAVAYDATAERWQGTLTIGTTVFQGETSGVFRLLEQLDKEYRASLVSEAKTS